MEQPQLQDNSLAGLNAFDRWLGYLENTNALEQPDPFYSYHASKYLAETRSLIWFAVRDGKYDLTGENKADILLLLQEEVAAACQCQNEVLCSHGEHNSSCDEGVFSRLAPDEAELILIICGLEKALLEYTPIVPSTLK